MLVSIIVPCYNQAQYLPEALDSVLAQTYSNWECIIVNDGSPDNTEIVAKEWIKKDERFKYLKKENGGLSSARNAGIKISTGSYILPLDADDKIGKDYLRLGVEVLNNNPEVKIVYGEAQLFGSESGIWFLSSFSLRQLALENMIYCSAFFRRSDFDLCNGYDETFLHGWEDWDLWLGILRKGGSVVKLPEVQFYYRKKINSMIENLKKNIDEQIQTRKKVFIKHIDLYTELFDDPIITLMNIEFLKGQLNETEKELNGRIENIYKSKRFRIGNFILKPISFLK
jgi:glycosyltransferase involved in cell wall biosynthesis